MSDVLKAQIAGCRAIVVSHHHGRLPFGIPPVSILPELLIRQYFTGKNSNIYLNKETCTFLKL